MIYWSKVDPEPQMTGILIKRISYEEMENMMETEIEVMQSKARKPVEPPDHGRVKDESSPTGFGGCMALPIH